MDILIAIAGPVAAVAAVVIAFWQVRRTILTTDQANALPVVTNLFNELRSATFQSHIEVVLTTAPDESTWPDRSTWPTGATNPGFGGHLSAESDQWRWSALQVAYFFEYLGILIAHRLIPEEVVVDATANSVARTWSVLEPVIRAERQRREEANKGTAVSSGFVRRDEHLVALTAVAGGPADASIHRRLNLRTVDGRGPADVTA